MATTPGGLAEGSFTEGPHARFLAMVAHELRNLLQVMRASIDILANSHDTLSTVDRTTLFDMLLRRSDDLEHLIDDLGSLASPGPTFAFVESIVRLRPILEAGAAGSSNGHVPPIVSCDPAVRVRADDRRLVQIVTNLVVNGYRHGAPPVAIDAAVHGRTATVAVRDHGRGVDEHDAAFLFEAFSPLARRKPGSTGLGLHVVRTLLREMGSDVHYEPAHPGARFMFTLPISPPAAPDHQALLPAQPPAPSL